MNKTTKILKKENTKSKKSQKLIFFLIAVLMAGLLTGGLLAKYRSDNQKQAEMIAAQFHVSSDYLAENNPSYDITDWQTGFDIQLYNYEKENAALISENEMTYTVELSGTSNWDCVDTHNGKIEKNSAKQSQSIRIVPKTTAGAGEKIKVTVKILQPFTKTLSATFHIQGKNEPDYSIHDQKDGTVLLTIQSNSYDREITISWDSEKYAPDNTNAQTESWRSSPQTLSVQKNTTYELLFFKKSVGTINQTSGSGITIALP